MNAVPPTARLILKLVQASAPEPIHAGDLMKAAGCAINTLKHSLCHLQRQGFIQRVDLGTGPCYLLTLSGEASASTEVAQ